LILFEQIRKIFKIINLSHLEPKLEIGITGRNNVFKNPIYKDKLQKSPYLNGG
jgi:hypothetical protein